MTQDRLLTPIESIERLILYIRGKRVMVDADLADLYGVPTKRLNEQVKRNIERFPEDFMFQLTEKEKAEVVANCDHLENLKYSRTLPFAFTEHGAIMAANVLKSEQAIEMSVFVVRAFVRLREVLSSHKALARKVDELESRLDAHDDDIKDIIAAIKSLMLPVKQKKSRKIGFYFDKGKDKA